MLVKGIVNIIHREVSWKQWRQIGNTICPQQGRTISQVIVPTELGDTMYAMREGVKTQALAAIAQRYKMATILHNKELYRDFGYLADKDATLQVLQGTYKYPESTDKYTKILLQEACEIYNKLSDGEVSDFLSKEEYKQYWRYVVKEKTQSLASGVHFGNYKVSSYDNDLSTLEAAKVSLAAATGTPLACWGTGITILLEKVPGNIHIDKMCPICLFEMNYNYLNKFVFSKQMMNKALDAGIVPAEQFAKRGLQANQGVVVSGLFCDIAQSLHKIAAIESIDLANCKDAVAHPIVSMLSKVSRYVWRW